MIAQIEKNISAFKNVIQYHENKVENKLASILHSDLYGRSVTSKTHELLNITDLKPNKINVCKHISINFPPGEILSDDKLKEIALEYKTSLGYENTPCILYKHLDKKHLHVHLVMPTVDYDGKLIRDSFEFDRSYAISRELEKKYNLSHIQEFHLPSRVFSFNEQFALNHSFQKAFKRAYYDPKAKDVLKGFFTKDEIDKLFSRKPLDNKSVLNLLDSKRFNTFYNFLDHKGYTTKHNKELLIDKLNIALNTSKSKSEYFTTLASLGIDVSLNSKAGKNNYIYSYPDIHFTAKDTRLPKIFTFNSISENLVLNLKDFIPPSEQKHIIYNSMNILLSNSNSLTNFAFNLIQSGFNVKLDNNSFKIDCNNQNKFVFDSFDINKKFSLKNLNNFFNTLENANRTISPLPSTIIKDIQLAQEQFYPSLNPYTGNISANPTDDDRDIRSKPRKRKKNIQHGL